MSHTNPPLPSHQQDDSVERPLGTEEFSDHVEFNMQDDPASVYSQAGQGQTRPPTLFVIFGAQGDLTKRKLIPALYNLAASHHLPQEFAILGVDGVSMNTEDFRVKIRRDIQELSTQPIESMIKEWLLDRLYYLSGDFRDPQTYGHLQKMISELNAQYGTSGNYLYYMATSPSFFGEIVQNLGAKGLVAQEKNQARRIVIEKPFGHDLSSAQVLNSTLRSVLDEKQIYRIDHYLG